MGTQKLASMCGMMLLLAGTAVQADLFVVPDEFETISAAADSAAAGDTVLVHPGFYEEEVRLRAGLNLIASSPDGPENTFIEAPFGTRNAVRLLAGSGSADDSSSVIGFLIEQSHDYGASAIYSANPMTLVRNCTVLHVGPGDNWDIPCVELRAGGRILESHISHGSDTSIIVSRDDGAQLVVEDCLIGGRTYPFGPGGFGENSVTLFKNNTFVDAFISVGIFNGTTNLTIVFVNNIFNGWGMDCQDVDPPPDSIDFRYNCFWPFFPEEQCPIGEGNFSADPLICDDTYPDLDWRLEPESPCLGTGENGEDIGARYGVCYPASAETPGGQIGRSWISQPHPNPTAGRVDLVLQAPTTRSRPLSVEVLDVTGRVLRSLAGEAIREYRLTWDGRLSDGRLAPTGIYFLRVRDGAREATRKVTIIE